MLFITEQHELGTSSLLSQIPSTMASHLQLLHPSMNMDTPPDTTSPDRLTNQKRVVIFS